MFGKRGHGFVTKDGSALECGDQKDCRDRQKEGLHLWKLQDANFRQSPSTGT